MNGRDGMPQRGSEVFIHPSAICETASVGAGTRIWAFAHVLPNARIGRDCNICDGVFIENDVLLGDRVTIKCGVQLWDGVTLEDDAFVGPNATFTNTMYPRSRQYQPEFLRTVVCKNASIGANATILPGISIGPNAMVGAGAVVTQSVPANAIVFGNPARVVGYVDSQEQMLVADLPAGSDEIDLPPTKSGVVGVTLHRIKSDSGISFEKDIPFLPRGFAIFSDVVSEKVVPHCAHRTDEQFFICLRGSCTVLVDDCTARREITMNRPDVGLYIPAMIWNGVYKFSDDILLLAFASGGLSSPIMDYGHFQIEIER